VQLRLLEQIMALFRIVTRTSAQSQLSFNLNLLPWRQAMPSSTFAMKTANTNRTKPMMGENFENKNKRLNRPLSPHLSIYKFQANMALSISHRITGLAQNGMLYGLALGAMVLPGNFPYYLGMLEAAHLNPALIFGAKFLVAFPFTYHLCHGLRHLYWDAGNGFTLNQVKIAGYISITTAVITAGCLTML